MSNSSKKNTLVHFLKVLAISLLAMFTIIANAGVWNAFANDALDGFYLVVSLLNFVSEAILIYFFAKKVLFVKKEE